jgi:dTMP kinase
MAKRGFYGKGIPGIDPGELEGLLVVLEGGDGSGRSTQSALLRDWLGRLGYPATEVGLKRSELVGEEIDEAMRGNTLGPRTMSLFYATDLADQLEHVIVPSLRAGFVVVADRYIYTLMARDRVRGANDEWIRSVYGIALKPDVVICLKADPKLLAERSFRKQGLLDYWESGMDIERSGDMYQCFVRYQNKLQNQFDKLSKEYGFDILDGEQDPISIHRLIQKKLEPLLKRRTPVQHGNLSLRTLRKATSNGGSATSTRLPKKRAKPAATSASRPNGNMFNPMFKSSESEPRKTPRSPRPVVKRRAR